MTVIDVYLRKIEPAKREPLERIRQIAKQVVPQASEIISYRMPTLQYQGVSFLGFFAHTNHVGIYPFSGEEIEVFKDQLKNFSFSKSAIRVPYDKPFPEDVLKKIIRHRLKRIIDQKPQI